MIPHFDRWYLETFTPDYRASEIFSNYKMIGLRLYGGKIPYLIACSYRLRSDLSVRFRYYDYYSENELTLEFPDNEQFCKWLEKMGLQNDYH